MNGAWHAVVLIVELQVMPITPHGSETLFPEGSPTPQATYVNGRPDVLRAQKPFGTPFMHVDG